VRSYGRTGPALSASVVFAAMHSSKSCWGKLMRFTYPGCLFALAGAFFVVGSVRADDAAHPPVKKIVNTVNHEPKPYDVSTPELLDVYLEDTKQAMKDGTFEGSKPYKEVDIMELKWDLGLWAVVVFVLLFLVLRTKAWGPILEGLQKREEHIRSAVEEAKSARAETVRIQAQYKAEMDAKFAEIPKIMEEARRDAEALKEELRSQSSKEITADRQRLRREIDNARDQALKEIWEQAAQLATLISAKVIGKSLSGDDHRRLIDESLHELRDASPGATR